MRVRMLLVPLVATAALLAGCTTNPSTASIPTPTTNGLDALSASEILDKAISALEDTKSFRAKGKGESDGTAVEVDLLFAGDDAKGTVTLDGTKVEIIQLGGSAYMKADAEFWKLYLPASIQALALPLIAGKYVKVPSTKSVLPKIDELVSKDGAKKGEVTTVAGKPVITVETNDGKLHVSLIGEPYPVDLVSSDGTIVFSDFNANATIEAPPAAQVFDASTFLG